MLSISFPAARRACGGILVMFLVSVASTLIGQEPAQPAQPAAAPAAETPAPAAEAPKPPAETPPAQPPAAEAAQPPAAAPAEPAPTQPSPSDAPPPAQPAPKEPAPAAVAPPVYDYARLGHPSVADQLELNDQQRAQVAQLLTERATQLAAAPADQRKAIVESFDQRLAAVLTDAQRSQLTTMVAEFPLRFNFREQPWTDVLNWFARQAGLALVMDKTPAGAFTYTSNRDYTPSEAIDLLNMVLLTKGFSLIQRNRMLILVSLSDNLPSDLIPRVEAEKISEYRDFEIIRVVFRLEGRPIETVLKEVEALIGPYGSSVALPSTGQLLITETAGKLRAISILIASIPKPQPPPKPEPKPEPPAPVLEVYPVANVKPAAAVETLSILFSNAKFTVDDKSEQVMAFARPSEQAGIKKAIEQMEANHAPDKRPRLEVYMLDSSDTAQAAELVEQLTTAVPEVQATVDATSGRLLVFASPEHQEAVREMVQKLGAAVDAGSRQVVVYAPKHYNPTALSTLITQLAPRAEVSADAQLRRVVVSATPAEQTMIQSLVEQLDKEATLEDKPLLQLYPLEKRLDPTVVTTLQAVVPEATITLSTDGRQLSVVARVVDQTVVKKMVEQWQEVATAQEEPELKIYPLEETLTATDVTTITSLVPGAQVTLSTDGRQLNVVARAQDQTAVETLIQRLTAAATAQEEPELKLYPLEETLGPTDVTTITSMVPGAQVTLSTDGRQLRVVARAKDQAAVEALITRLTAAVSAQSKPEMKLYPLSHTLTATDVASLTALVPTAQVTLSPDGRQLRVVALAQQHEEIAKLVAEMLKAAEAEVKSELVVYPLSKPLDATVMATLQTLVPTAKLTMAANAKELVVVAAPDDQAIIKKTLDQIAVSADAVDQRELEIYQMKGLAAAELQQLLQALAVHSTITLDAAQDRLIVWGPPEEHAAFAEVVNKLQQDPLVGTKPVLQFYPLENEAQFTSVSSVLTSLVPTARLTWDAQHKRVMVTATPREQQRVAETIQEIVQQAGPIEEQALQLYPLTATQQTRFEAVQADVLADLPGARVIKDPQTGELAVWAKPSQHQKLSEVLEQLKSSTEQTEAALLIGYTIENGSAQTVFDMLKQLFPSYKITLDDKADRILVYAPLSAHGRIKQTIAQMDVEGSPAGEEELRSYSTGTSDPTPILPMLQTLVADMQLTADVAGRKIVAWGTVRDHEVLAKAVAQFRDGDESQRPTVKAYPLPGRSVTSLLYMRTALTQIVPNAAITIDPRGGSIVASANEEDHRKLKEAIDEIVKLDDNVAQTLEIYRLDRITATAAIAALTPIVPEARLSQGSDARELVVWATAEDQQRVKAALEKLEQHVDGDDQRVLQMHQVDPSLAVQLSTMMATTLPHVQVVAGPGTDRPLVWATPKDHQRLTELIARMEGEMGLDKPRVMKTYELDDLSPAEAQRVLAAAIGNLEYVTSPAADRLVIRTDEATHAEVSKLLEELKQAVAKPEQMLKVHRFDPDTLDVASVYAALSTEDTKELTIQVNPTTNSLIVRGPADRQVALGETITALMDQLPRTEKAEAVVYRLDRADPSAASILIRSLLPAVPMAVDVANRTLAITATQRDHAKVREVLEQLDDKGEGDLLTETYVMKRAYPSTVMTAIQPIVPRAKMSADIYNKMLIVTATAEDHAVIKEIVDRVDGGADGDLITKAYPLKYANAYTISTALTQVVPTASVSPDAVNKMLIVTASESDHQRIQAVLDQADKRGGGDLITKAYTLMLANPSTIAVALQSVVPNATVSADAVNKMLVVTATEEDHKRVQSIVDETDRRSEGEVTTEVYALKFANATSLSYSIKPIAPNATASPDPYNKTLIVTASAKDHERIKAVIDQADKRGGGDLITKAYTVKWAYPATISTALSTVVPDATISADVTNKMLIVTANKEDHDKIQEVIDQADKRGGGELVTRAYMLQTANPSAIMLALRPVVPDATVSADATTKMLIVTASEEDHTKIAAIVDEADRRADGDLITQVYTLKWANPSALYASLLPIAPQATISPDVYNKTLIVTATAKDHERIKPIIEQADTRGGGELTTKSYALKWANAYTITTALTTAVPDAKISPDPVNKMLIVTANAEDHAKIEEVINQADMRGGGELTTRTYALKWANPYTITTALTSVVPDAKVSPDTLNKMLIVTANLEDHAKIAKIVKQADKRGGGDLITETYLLQTANPSTMTVALRPVVPDATLSPDPTNKMLVVTASAEDHARIKAIIDQADRRADGELLTQVYTLKWANPSALYASLLPIAPQATISPDVYNKTLIVTATAKDHERLKPVIEQADTRGGGELTTKSYALKWANPYTIYTALTTAVPDAKVSPDAVNKMLIVTANAEDHVKIEEVIKQADTRGGGELTTKSYALKWANPSTITTALASVVPDAKVSPDTLNKMLIVTANAEDHVKIQEVVDQADKRGGGDLTTEAYSLRTADPSTIMVALRPVVPDATISADATNQLLIVTASKEDHLRVKTIVDAADRRSEGELVTEAYPLKWANPTTLMTSLRPIVPNATISADPTNRALMVTASAADQVLVKKVVEQADRRGEGEMTTEVYLLTRAEPLSVQRALTPLVPDATIGVDSSSKTLIVTAPQPDQEKIRLIVERADRRGAGELLTKVYPLKLASPTTAVNTLEVLIPNAQMNADTATNTLVVTGTAEDHAMVAPLVKELDVASPLSPVLKPYSVRNSNAEEVYESLSQLFRYNRDVNVGFQEETGTIMVFAPLAEQDEVGQAISEIERLTAGRPKATLDVYDLEGIDGDAAIETLTSLLKDETPKVELQMDSANNQILAIAEAEQQLRIREALTQLKPVEREVEVFTLSRVDPFSAESAITTLFMDLPFAAAPSVDTDPDSQQLIVHGTKKQLQRIRDLLEKMGEAAVATADMPRSTVRVVPLSGDMENTLREIERLWPQVRGNRVQIVTPPNSRQPRLQPLSPTPSTPDTRDERNTPAPTPPAAPPEPEPAKDSNAARHASRVPVMFASLQTQQAPDPEPAPTSNPAPEPAPAQPPAPASAPEAAPPATSEAAPAPVAETTPSPLATVPSDNNESVMPQASQPAPAPTAAAPSEDDAASEFEEPALPPILIIPGSGRVTIASNDLEALDQLEELLQTMQRRSRRIEFSTGNFSMLVLRNADAKEMAETLNEVFERESRTGSSRYGSSGRRRSTLRVVADERMNALLVYGSAADRATVEEMVEVLDTDDIPDPLTAEKPRMIPVKNLPAATVLSVLTSVYRSQLEARRGLKPVTIPVGISGEMTSMLELINATANSPILTLDVDETTNSILIRAPRQLGEEIEEFIAELDQKAVDGGTKTMSLVPLKGMNSDQIEEALQMLMRGGGRYRRSWGR